MFAILSISVGIILVTFGYLSANPSTNGGEIFEDIIEDENADPIEKIVLDNDLDTTKSSGDNFDEPSHETIVDAGGRLISHSNDIGGSDFGSSYEFGYGSSFSSGSGGGSGSGGDSSSAEAS